MIALPPMGSQAREAMGPIETIVEMLSPEKIMQLPTFPEARFEARRAFESAKIKPKRIFYVAIMATGEIYLVSFGARGSFKKEWRFGII